MKKLSLSIILLVVIVLLVLVDARLSLPSGLQLPKTVSPSGDIKGSITDFPEMVNHPNLTQSILESNPTLSSYLLEKRTRSLELFETFDLSRLIGLAAYKNILVASSASDTPPIFIYELHSSAGQGKANYLNLKLAMQSQLSDTQALNETNDYGQSSLFYNNDTEPSTAFLLTQIGDIILGFKYSKASQTSFQFIRQFINSVPNNS